MSSWSSWLKPRQHVEAERSIPIGSTEPANKLYKENSQSTTKYNLITFLPKALFEQYRSVNILHGAENLICLSRLVIF